MIRIFIIITIGFLLSTCKTVDQIYKEKPLKFTNLFGSDWSEDVSCYRIPAIVTATNGDLIVAIDERVPSCGDLKWSEDINIVLKRSFDNGEHWTEIERIIDFPLGLSASDPSMIVDKVTGDVIMFYNYMDHKKAKDVYFLHMIKSRDHGASWSEPIDITSQIAKPAWANDFKFITSGRGIQTHDGTLLHTLVNLDHGMHVFKSEDHGNNWEVIDQPLQPGDESKIVELSDKSWMVNCRNNGAGNRQVHISKDKGKHWINYTDKTLIDPGCNATILSVPASIQGQSKSILLFANANDIEKRTNLSIRYSLDDGKSWSTPKTVYQGPSAYSTMDIMSDGNIGLVFEQDEYKSNVFTSLSLSWITDGKIKNDNK